MLNFSLFIFILPNVLSKLYILHLKLSPLTGVRRQTNAALYQIQVHGKYNPVSNCKSKTTYLLSSSTDKRFMHAYIHISVFANVIFRQSSPTSRHSTLHSATRLYKRQVIDEQYCHFSFHLYWVRTNFICALAGRSNFKICAIWNIIEGLLYTY